MIRYWIAVIMFMAIVFVCVSDHIPTQPATLTPLCLETSVSSINFFDAQSAEAVLGLPIRLNDTYLEKPMASYYNHDGREMLSLAYDSQNPPNHFHYFYVGAIDKAVFPFPRLKNITTFETGKGIHIGMTAEEVTAILGSPFSSEKESMGSGDVQTILRYLPVQDASSGKSMPAYRSEYTFWNNRLRQFSFGFE